MTTPGREDVDGVEVRGTGVRETGKLRENGNSDDPPPPLQDPARQNNNGKKLALKVSFALMIPWALHLVFAAIIYHIEEPHEQELLMKYQKKKNDLMALFEKCKDVKTSDSELPECVAFKENWFNLTLQLAQEDPGTEKIKIRNHNV